MKRMVIKSVLTLQVLLLCAISIAQTIERQIIEDCQLIVEAEVVKQEYRYNPKNQHQIETLNYLEVSKYLKGENPYKEMVIVTQGGTIDGITQIISHTPKLDIGQKGIFFLEEFEVSTSKLITIFHKGEDRKLLYTKGHSHEVYCTYSNQYFESKGMIIRQIDSKYDQIVEITSSTSELCLTIDNIKPDLNNKKVRFDVKIKANQNGFKLSELALYFDYPKENLGEYIVNEENLNISRGIVIQDEIYKLNIADIKSTKVGIMISTDCNVDNSLQFLDSHYTLSTSYEKLLTVEVNIQEWGSFGDFAIENFVFDGSAKYILAENECYDFNQLCVDRGGFEFKNCTIASFDVAPFGAGVQQIMSIRGMCFGDSGEIRIPNSNDGGKSKITISSTDTRWIRSWTDMEIRVLVSSLAPGDNPMGSGEWEIHPDNHMMCMNPIDIEYAISNTFVNNDEKMVSIAHSPFAGNESFEWYLDETAISTNPQLISQGITLTDIMGVCEKAFCDWESSTNIEFEFMGNNSNGASATDQRYTITVGPVSGDIRAVTSNRFSTSSDCELIDPFIDARLFDSDITFDEGTKWFVSTSLSGIADDQFDFYSAISHEIGHMLLMKHSCDIPLNETSDDRIMYFELNSSDQKRTIDAKTLNGIEIQKARTIAANGGCQSGFDLNTDISGCSTNSIYDINSQETFKVYPNPISGSNPFIESDDVLINDVTIFNSNGQKMFTEKNIKSHQYRPKIELKKGIYLIIINESVASKIIVL